MKKILSRTIVIFVVLAVIGILTTKRGTFVATSALIKNNRILDPTIESCLAAYSDGNSVVLTYIVEDINKYRQKRVADQYWVRVHLDRLNADTSVNRYEIFRHPLPETKRTAMKPLHIVDLRKQVAPAADASWYRNIYEFIDQHDNDPLPQVYVDMESALDKIYIRYSDPVQNKIKTYRMSSPRGEFMPLKNFPRVVLCYPFALARDILVVPFLWVITPFWN